MALPGGYATIREKNGAPQPKMHGLFGVTVIYPWNKWPWNKLESITTVVILPTLSFTTIPSQLLGRIQGSNRDMGQWWNETFGTPRGGDSGWQTYATWLEATCLAMCLLYPTVPGCCFFWGGCFIQPYVIKIDLELNILHILHIQLHQSIEIL